MARYRGRRVMAKRYPVGERRPPWPAPPDPSLLSALNHPNTQRFVNAFEDEEGSLVVVFGWMEGRTLAEALGRDSGPSGGEPWRDLAIQGARALRWLHDRCTMAPVVHGDVTPGNLFLCYSGRVRLLDPLAVPPGLRPSGQGIILGTLPCMAPEVLDGGPLDTPADIYSLGMALLAAALGGLPWSGARNPVALGQSLRKNPPDRLVQRAQGLTRSEKAHLAALVGFEPASRPTAAELCRCW